MVKLVVSENENRSLIMRDVRIEIPMPEGAVVPIQAPHPEPAQTAPSVPAQASPAQAGPAKAGNA
jgi:hypothetical protein